MKRTRSKRIGLLTDNERDYLEGKINIDSKQRSKFLNSLFFRVKTCSDDLDLILYTTKNNQFIENWYANNFFQLQTVRQPSMDKWIFAPLSLGKIKYKTIKSKGKKRGTRYYWFDARDGPMQFINKPLDQTFKFRGIKPYTVKKVIMKAFRSGIIPKKEKEALSILQIKKKLKRVKI